MALKYRRGRWPEIAPIVADPGGQIAAEGMIILPISLEHARAAGLLDWEHHDPFDRMLAAQAIVEGTVLVYGRPRLRRPASRDVVGLTRARRA